MKHTKGPWEDVNLGSKNIWIIDEEGNYIAETIGADEEGRYIKNDEEREANAHLIAAAPELLEACKEMHEALKDIINAANNEQPYGAHELEQMFLRYSSMGYEAICKAEAKN